MAAPTKIHKDKATPPDRSLDMRGADGKKAGSVQLAGAVFGLEPNVPVMHQVVVAQMAAARAGTHSTKTRAEVRGGGAKPYRQKGTGRARQGSIRAPHWRGGGVAHGPKPRDYSQRTPKKMVQLALRCALSDRASDDKVVVVERWSFDKPKTRAAREALDALDIPASNRVLVVLNRDDDVAWKSFRNLAGDRRVHCILESELNAYEVLVADWVVFTQSTLDLVTQRLVNAGKATPGRTPTSSGDEPKSSADAPPASTTDEAAASGTGEGD